MGLDVTPFSNNHGSAQEGVERLPFSSKARLSTPVAVGEE